MTIKRKFNDITIEIELTPQELFDAYCEKEHEWDVDSCKNYFENTYCDEEWYDQFSQEAKDNIIEEAAMELRRNLDHYDMTFDYAISEAFSTAIGVNIEED